MTILYDFSQYFGALVLGTSNKSELLLGYGTLYGDMAHALNPIGDLYKTQLRQLAAHLGVPEPVLVKPPTADLFTGQTDEAQIGYSYAAIDAAFVHLIEDRLPPDAVVAMGFDAEFIRRVMRMVQRSQFKRRLPVIAKISERTIDRDFRYSRDWCY
jgi:NAD+ synthase